MAQPKEYTDDDEKGEGLEDWFNIALKWSKAMLDNPSGLTESMAVVPVTCSNCLDDIDIGDFCYVDTSNGTEEGKAKVYCEECIKDIL